MTHRPPTDREHADTAPFIFVDGVGKAIAAGCDQLPPGVNGTEEVQRFESVRRLCKSGGKRRILGQVTLLLVDVLRVWSRFIGPSGQSGFGFEAPDRERYSSRSPAPRAAATLPRRQKYLLLNHRLAPTRHSTARMDRRRRTRARPSDLGRRSAG